MTQNDRDRFLQIMLVLSGLLAAIGVELICILKDVEGPFIVFMGIVIIFMFGVLFVISSEWQAERQAGIE